MDHSFAKLQIEEGQSAVAAKPRGPRRGSRAGVVNLPAHSKMSIEGFILTGGASSRMGADKSRLMFGTETAVARLARQLSVLTARVSTVGRSETASNEIAHVADIHSNWGALGGIHAALRACEADWAAVVACDLPFVAGELWSRLWSLAAQTESQMIDAVVPIQPDGRPQPLCALYRREPCLNKAEEMIAAGEHTPRAVLAAISTRWVQPDELSDLLGAEHFFFNMNSAEDYARAKQILAQSAS